MRPIKLEIEGLHSFEANQVIDFNALSSENIFGIFGQTGSGKSTILDAIVLALYGRVQRSKTNSDFINTKSKKAEIKFNFAFNDEGTQKEFLIIRSFKRKAKKETEVDQVAEIFEVGAFGTKQLMEGASKVDKFVTNLLGMSETEFLKCVALPQGEFAAFLKAKPNERISIIGNIFDLNKYGDELWEKVKNRCDSLETEMAVLSGKLSVLGEVDEEALLKEKSKSAELNDEIEKTAKELSLISKTEKEEREVVSLLSELEEVNKKVSDCEEEKGAITFKKTALMRAKKLNENKFLIEREGELASIILNENNEVYKLNESINAEKSRLNKFEAESAEELDDLNNGIKELGLKLESVRAVVPVQKELKNLEKELEELKLEKNIIEKKIETSTRKLSNKKLDKSILGSKIVEIGKEIEDIRLGLSGYDALIGYSSLTKFSEELKGYQKFAEDKHSDAVLMLSSAISAVDRTKKEENDIIAKIETLQKKYFSRSSLKEPIMLEEREKVNLEYAKFVEFKTRIEDLENEHLKLIKKLNAKEALKAKKEEEKIELDEKYKDVYEDVLALRGDLERLLEEKNQALSEAGISNVIRKVKIGDSCPICKSEVLQKNSAVSIDFIVLDNDIDALKKNTEIKEEKKESLVYKTARVMSAIEGLEKDIEELNLEIGLIKKAIQESFVSYFGEYVADVQSKLSELEKSLNERKEQVITDFKKEAFLFEKLRSIRESNIKNNVLSLVAKEQSSVFAELMNSLASSISEKDVEMLGIVSQDEDFASKIEEMQKINTKLDEKLKERENLNSELFALGDEILALETELATFLEQKKANAENLQKTMESIKERESRVSKVVLGSAVDMLEVLEKDLENKKHRIEELAVLKKEQEDSLNNLKNSLMELVVLNKTHSEEHRRVSGELQEMLKVMDALSLEEVKPFMISEEETLVLENNITQFETKFKHYLKRKEELEEKLNGRVSGEAILEQLAIQVVDINSKLETLKLEQVKLEYEIKNKDEKLHQIEEISSSIKKLEQKYSAAKELYSSIKGKALLEYIAEEYIDDITFMASNKLQILMDGKYELKYEDREFFVVDNFNDGAIRPVATLSGGEMFVVSLALALSISDAIVSKSNKAIDFFFLDEGFGTLDKEYCEYIVDSLMKLTSGNLTVGLISHVPELQERISQKIYITKTSNGSVIKNVSSL